MNRHTSWELTEFHPISFCNTYGLHLIRNGDFTQIMVLDINGTAHCHWKSQKKTINLKEFFEEERNYADFDLELVASDSYLLDKHDCNSSSEILFLATCWIVYDKLFAPKRHFAALYRITIESLETELAAKFDLQNVPTYTRISATPPTNVNGEERKLYWLIFAYSEGSCGFSIETESNRVEPVERIGDIFPFLDIRDFPGSAIRSHCRVIGSHRLSLVSYDTGYVIASVCLMQSGIIIDRKSLKFDGPISVLKVIDTKVEEEGVKLISILISSTIGPVTVWELRLQDDMLSWELASVLLESEHYDTVITAAVHRGLIFVGTYAELLLIYELKEVLQNRTDEVAPVQTVNIASPILAISSLDNQQLVVLSNKGLHRLKPSIPLDSPLDAMQNSY